MKARLAGPVPSPEELTELMRKRCEALKVNRNFLKWKLEALDKLMLKENRHLLLDLVNLLLSCDVDYVIKCLWMCSDDPSRPHQDNWNHLLGLEYQDLDDSAKLFRRATTQLEKLAGGRLFQAFILSNWKQVEVKRSVQLLESCARLLSDSHSKAKLAILKKRPTTAAYRAALIAHVWDRMTTPHDADLSRLYEVTTGKTVGEDSWSRWRYRSRNKKRIAEYRRPKVS